MSSSSASTLRQQMFAKGATRTALVTVGAGADALAVEVRSLSAGQRGALLGDCLVTRKDEDGNDVTTTDLAKLTPALVIAGAHDPETHQPLFTEADRDAVNLFDAVFIDPIWKKVAELSGISATAAAVAEKNSDVTTVSDSASGSPASSV